MWLAGVLAVLLLGLGFSVHVPYVELSPGPAINTLGTSGDRAVLGITGAKTYKTDGRLDLTTVSVRDKISLLEALGGWFSGRKAVIPREFVYPPDQTDEQNEEQTKEEMQTSQNAAMYAALSELKLARVKVESVVKNGPSAAQLKVGDIITAVDGVKVYGPDALRAGVRKHRIGEVAVITFERGGQPGTASITTGPSADKEPKAAIGVVTGFTTPIKVDISLKDIGGPSAGLMFALGIIDKLGPESLTGGKHIAGTGTIEVDGAVGPIGGIAEKLIGARDVGATVFLVPADNCKEAVSHRPDGLQLVRVQNLEGALSALSAVRAGRTAPSC
jgi:PDZ domain-containing protein